MTTYFTRLRFAFRSSFSILDRDRIPDDVLAALHGPASSPGQPAAPAIVAEDATGHREVQVLGLLQREGRLVDFLMEDLGS